MGYLAEASDQLQEYMQAECDTRRQHIGQSILEGCGVDVVLRCIVLGPPTYAIVRWKAPECAWDRRLSRPSHRPQTKFGNAPGTLEVLALQLGRLLSMLRRSPSAWYIFNQRSNTCRQCLHNQRDDLHRRPSFAIVETEAKASAIHPVGRHHVPALSIQPSRDDAPEELAGLEQIHEGRLVDRRIAL